jgi:uncharacterized membrane protein YqhA
MLPFALSLRFFMLIAVAGASIGAALLFWEGGSELTVAVVHVFASDNAEKAVIAAVMESTDKFLFGVVLVIFAYSIAFGFVFELAPAVRDTLPDWMRVNGIDQLKHTFFRVILVYLAVDFATDIAESENHSNWQTLVMPASIFLLAGALRLLTDGHTDAKGH